MRAICECTRTCHQRDNELLHFLRWYDPIIDRLNLQQTQAKYEKSRAVCLNVVSPNSIWLSLFLHGTGGAEGPVMHFVRQLAAKGYEGRATEVWANQKAVALDGSDRTLHAGARDYPVS